MPVITYTAVDRGRLASGHTATTSYQIECELEGFPETMVRKGTFEETLEGAPEGWLDALQFEYQITTDLILPADLEDWREFLSSVAGAEVFQIDLTGTIASPGTDIDVWLVPTSIAEQQIGAAGYKYSFRLKTTP